MKSHFNRCFSFSRLRVVCFEPQVVCLLSVFLAFSVQADVGPGLSGITARADDASSAFWSPAGLTRIKQPEFMGQSILVHTESKFKVDQSNISGGNAKKDDTLLLIPALFYVHPVDDKWSLGTSLTVPAGFGNDYGKKWSGRYLADKTELAFISLGGTVAYKVSDQLSVGGGPSFMYVSSYSRARVNNLVADDGRVKLNESGSGVGWQLGMLFEPSKDVRLGVVYRSEINLKLSGKPKFKNVSPILEDALKLAGVYEDKIHVKFRTPAQVQLGFYQAFADDWSYTVDAMWVDMSEFGVTHVRVDSDSVSVKSEFEDIWLYSAGLRYQYQSDLAFSVGALYVESPAKDGKRIVALPLDRVISFGGGVEWQWNDLEIHSNLSYADFGNGDVKEDGGLAGSVEGSFSTNNAIIFDTQIIKRF